HQIPDLAAIAFVMRLVALGDADGLLHDRMCKPALDPDDDRLVVLVAHNGAMQYALRHIPDSLRLVGCRLLGSNRLDPGDVAADGLDARGLLELAGRLLEAQVELLLLQLRQLFVQLVGRQIPNILRLHDLGPSYSAMR